MYWHFQRTSRNCLVYIVLRLKVFCGELSPRLKYFHLYSKYITLTVFLPRFWHHNLHWQNRLSYLQLSQNECFLWRMNVRYSASCQRMICTTFLACIIKLLVSRDTGPAELHSGWELRLRGWRLECGCQCQIITAPRQTLFVNPPRNWLRTKVAVKHHTHTTVHRTHQVLLTLYELVIME